MAMKDWPWQKWLGKAAPIVIGIIASGIWDFAELPAPTWAGAIAGVATLIVQTILTLFPIKPKT